ncbi:AzlD domain-containing protein [Marivita sp.]|uniref:AzlD domain-containing protein n=1 Tax=Marivita sp. TaxID=2003365 RepID=UPI0025B84B6E|nr:AzlD domain-containing protein [Marivita sp.]
MSGSTEVWVVIVALGLGSFGLRFVFLGLVGDRAMPDWFLRHLRYTAVAVLPALVAPLVVWPNATDGDPDPARLAAAIATVSVGYLTKNVIAGMGVGAAILIGLTALL